MTTINRRQALGLGAAGALPVIAFGTAPVLAQEAAGAAEANGLPRPVAPGAPGPRWYRLEIGEAIVTIVQDGVRIDEGPYPTFGEDEGEETVRALMRENLLPETRFAMSFAPTLVETAGELVLFDTGFGESERENGLGRLRERMAEAGYAPEDVTVVALTHFHRDHIAGLVEGGEPAFPNARYVAGRREYEWWTSPEALAGERADAVPLVERTVVPFADRMSLVAEGDEIVPGIVAHEAFGHSPGHMIFSLEAGGSRVWIVGDLAVHFVTSLQRPDWRMVYDQDDVGAAGMRREIFGRLAEEREPFIGYHMPFPSIGYVREEEDGFRYVPLSYQLDVEAGG